MRKYWFSNCLSCLHIWVFPEEDLKMKSVFAFILLVVFSFIFTANGYSQEVRYGTIKGQLFDYETKTPLMAVNISIENTQTTTVSNSEGHFTIERVPVGNYTVKFSLAGYETLSKTDVIVKSNRITFLPVELKALPIRMDEVIVTGGYFPQEKEQATIAVNFSSEEVRRSPGTAGDVSRIVYGLPSVAKVSDTQNTLFVRGGSGLENSFFIDNIEIPNVNHFPEQGSSGGPIGMLNVDFIQDVDFYTGGFSAIYGDSLSSVMDMSFREGNRDEFDGQLDLHFAGLGGVAESPIGNQKGSWLFSARRSYLDLLVEVIGESDVPKYSDYQAKLVYDLSDKHKITMLDILGIDSLVTERDNAVENEENMYGPIEIAQNTAGFNWRYLWGSNGFSDTSISHTIIQYDVEFFETRNYIDTEIDKILFDQDSNEQEFKLRNVNYFTINPSHKLEFGIEAKHVKTKYDNFYGEFNDLLGNFTPAFGVDDNIGASKLHAFLSHSWKPFSQLILTPGLRVGHFTYNENTNVSPRLSVSYQLNDRTSINASTGVYYQHLPLVLLSQNKSNKALKTPRAHHYVLGMSHLLTENTRLTVEAYDKEYAHLPLDPIQPSLSIIDQVVDFGIFMNQNPLVDTGEAYSRGVEVMLQKKLVQNLYGMASASYFRAKYKGYDGVLRNRVFDNQYMLNLEGGYKPNNKWEFSVRWIWAGGAPYTPFDIPASEAAHRGIYDAGRINGARRPDYHSLNLRFDRRFYFSGSNLIFYLSVWNVYGRKNISSYYWNEIDNKQETSEGWGTVPVFGVEFEF
jgi:hypothetical protein